ncbi:MAG TPA: DUF4129 domain-containing protein, partial [Planctomycetaceae bacterium]|nr:DUF4129 domain-containing protein [Planctomycetaceae bacterium]
FSNLRNVFVARQAHAHTWVEVYLDPEHLPDELKALSSFPDWSHGGWLRLDPTPARDLTPVEALLGGMENWWAWLCEAWEQYVMGMNRQQQRELVYGPLRRSFLARLRRVGTLAWWKELWEQVRRAPGWLAWYFAEGRWFSWRGGLAAVVLLLTGYFLWRGLCALARLARILWSRVARHRDDSRRVQVAFYRRFEALLARRGLRRRTSQTPREFATAAGGQLAAVTGHAGLEGLPRQVADAFYQVRFGDTALEPLQEQAVDEALGRLEEALRAHPQRRLLARLNVRPEAVRRPT